MKKDYGLDLMRICAMLLVIVIHVSNYYSRSFTDIDSFSYFFATIFNGLARVSVPIFFMISGALLIPKVDNFDQYKKRVFKLLVTLVVWSFIYYLWNKYVMNYNIYLLSSIFTTIFEPSKAHLWFLYALIGIYLVLPFIRKMLINLDFKEEMLFVKLWVSLVGGFYLLRLILQIFKINTTITYPVPIIQGTYYLGYFILGYIIYRYIDKIKISNKLLGLAAGLSLIITIIGTFIVSLIMGSYYEGLFAYRSLFYIIASSSIFVYVLKNKEDIITKRVTLVIDLISPYSFGIYLIHVIFLNMLMLTIEMHNITALVGIPTYTIILFAISYLSIYLLKKIKHVKEIL
jgi:surface polysaccharide O-acyltransferase-like enzyme